MNLTKSSKVLFHGGICEGESKTIGIESLVFCNEEIKKFITLQKTHNFSFFSFGLKKFLHI
jgi:hypothetical protein